MFHLLGKPLLQMILPIKMRIFFINKKKLNVAIVINTLNMMNELCSLTN